MIPVAAGGEGMIIGIAAASLIDIVAFAWAPRRSSPPSSAYTPLQVHPVLRVVREAGCRETTTAGIVGFF